MGSVHGIMRIYVSGLIHEERCIFCQKPGYAVFQLGLSITDVGLLISELDPFKYKIRSSHTNMGLSTTDMGL